MSDQPSTHEVGADRNKSASPNSPNGTQEGFEAVIDGEIKKQETINRLLPVLTEEGLRWCSALAFTLAQLGLTNQGVTDALVDTIDLVALCPNRCNLSQWLQDGGLEEVLSGMVGLAFKAWEEELLEQEQEAQANARKD